MTKKELEKEAEEYALNQWEGNLPWSVIQKSYYDGALPREKQIQIDAEQIRALQKKNGELIDENRQAKEIIRNFLEYYELKHSVCGFDSEKQKEKAKAFLKE